MHTPLDSSAYTITTTSGTDYISPIPEPSTAALLGLGALTVAFTA